MLKLLDTSAYLHKGEQAVSVIDFNEKLEKRAATQEIESFLLGLEKKPNHTYLHINAMGASEYWGINRNGDNFPEEMLKQHYKTFVTSPAHVFRHHINKDPKKSFGVVIFATYNENMHRVELIAECPDDLIADAISRIKLGDYPSTSMACKTPFDVCSICGNKAHSRQEYCSHLRTEIGRLYPDGRRVSALNIGPLKFFDISIVTRGADPTSYILKSAGEGAYLPLPSSLEAAEVEGLVEKTAELKKWSELIKEVTGGEVLSADSTGDKILDSIQDPGPETIELLSSLDISHALTGMAHLGISPSLRYLSELIARKFLGEGYEGIGLYVQEFLSTIPGDAKAPHIEFSTPAEVDSRVHLVLKPYLPVSSLTEGAVEKRASMGPMTLNPDFRYTSGVGYAGLGPRIEPTQHEIEQARAHAYAPGNNQDFFQKYGKLLFQLGIASLLAKYYITSQIEKKFKEEESRRGSQNGAKIILINKVARDLSKRSLLKEASHLSNPPHHKEEEGRSTTGYAAYKITKTALRNTRTTVGNKLADLLKLSVVTLT